MYAFIDWIGVAKPAWAMDLRFCEDLEKARTYLKQKKGGDKNNTMSLGELFKGFFRFYGHEFDFTGMCASIKKGRCMQKESTSWRWEAVLVL